MLISKRGHIVSIFNISGRYYSGSTPLAVSGAVRKNVSWMGQGNVLGGTAAFRMRNDEIVSRGQLVSEL